MWYHWFSVANAMVMLCVLQTVTAQRTDGPLLKTTTTPSAPSTVSYVIYVPKTIRSNADIQFRVSFPDSDIREQFQVEADFVSSDREISYNQLSGTILGGSSTSVTMGRIPLGYKGSTNFMLNVTGRNLATGDVVFSEETKDFKFASKAVTILIQTDKAIYRPSEIIKFRALCMTPDLRPLSGVITYKVEDPNGNVVLLEPDVALSKGVAGGELLLTRNAIQGDWKVIYEYQGYEETLPVTVEIYKLPKFEVEVDAPAFIHPSSPGITVSLKAKYTFGQPVSGSGLLVVELLYAWGSRRSPRQTITKTLRLFDGDMDVFISKDEIRNNLNWNENSDELIEVTGFVTERLTSTTFNDSTRIEAKRHHIKVDALSKPDIIKPGLLYQALVRVTEQDGKMLMESDRLKNKLIIQAEYTYPYRPISTTPPFIAGGRRTIIWRPSRIELITYTYEIPPNGVIRVNIDAKDDDFISVRFRAYTNATKSIYQNQWTASRARSPSESFMQLTAAGSTAEGEVTVGEMAAVTIRANQPLKSLQVLVIARGKVLLESFYREFPSGNRYTFTATSEMTPSVLVLASFVRNDSEIVADYIKINVALALQNQVVISNAEDSVDAATPVSFRIQTSASNSYIGIRAIDQSVLLLKSGNDITNERVVSDLGDYSDDSKGGGYFPRPFFYFPFSSGAKDASQVFKEAGFNVLTNALVYRYKDPYHPPPPFFPFAAREIQPTITAFATTSTTPPSNAAASKSTNSGATRTRSRFPESWIWDNRITGDDGSVTFDAVAPDTITSWQISAFSMSDEVGLGIADPYKLTVFRKFFVSLNLPLKITRGEIIIVQAIVFNYYDQDLVVGITLQIGDGVELLIPEGADAVAAGRARNLTIRAGGAASVKYPVRISKLGEVPIRVVARSPRAGDAVERKVFVKPEGIPQCYTASELIHREVDNKNPTTAQLQLRIPNGIVAGSAKATLHVYGNILGSSMSNLGRLLRAPYGCGEQNMLSFAPDVFVGLYLDNTGQLDADTRKEVYTHFTNGYQNQLRYRRDDGSFSAFGKRDKSGSTWLTAFVAKCFLFARRLRPALVQESVTDDALEFLVDQQRKDGSFGEPGLVRHTAMQGGVNSAITMTAYVLITLRETPFVIRDRELVPPAESARAYLESHLDQIMRDRYALAIVTYALHVSESSRADDALRALNALATEEEGFRYWHEDTEGASSISRRWRPPYRSPPSNDIEMTAYALLTYVRRNDLGPAIPILRWLISKQNDLGGYSSTQDTVIAIQALAAVAENLRAANQSLVVGVTHSAEATFSRTFHITSENSIVYNTVDVPAVVGDVEASALGTGIGVTQLSVCYNIPTEPYAQTPFNCSVNINSPDKDSAMLGFCCSLNDGDTKATGMFLFEIGLLNGFSVDALAEEERNKKAKIVELDEDSVNIYFDELGVGERLCANVLLIRVADVAAVKPASLSAFEYYKSDKKFTTLYDVDGLRESGICDVCGHECVGCPAPSLGDWKPWTPCAEFCKPEMSTRTRQCIDPSLKSPVDPTGCGLSDDVVESRECPKLFSCPTLSDGLWFILPRSYRPRYFSRSCYYTTSRVRYNRRGPTSIIPGISLNGNGEYVQCNDRKLRTINPSEGLTMSFLVRPRSYTRFRPTTFLSVGENNKLPVLIFQKSLFREDLRFLVGVGFSRYQVKGIPISSIPVGQWSHVILTWSTEDGANVYVNGSSVGRYSSYTSRTSRRYTGVNLLFNLGRTSFGNQYTYGYLNGDISAFNYWKSILPLAANAGLSAFYREITSYTGKEPLLSVRHIRDFLHPSKGTCITKPSTLSALYSAKDLCPSYGSIFPGPFVIA